MNELIGYIAQKKDGNVLLERSAGGVIDKLSTKSFNEFSEWITQEYPNSIHIVWQLLEFADVVLSLIPKDKREELSVKTKIIIGDTKIFLIDRWFGITRTEHLHGNFYKRRETNLFSLQQWIPDATDNPLDATQVVKYGEQVEEALDAMNIDHDRLTSPVGVYGIEMRQHSLPTTATNKDIIDASFYCEIMMRREWRSAYKIGYFDKTYDYDQISSYPTIIADLPDTDNCIVKYSKQWLKADWGIIKAKVTVDKDFTPIIYDTDDGEHILPLGERLDIFTTEELYWIHNHQAGKIEFIDGYFFKWLSDKKPYYDAVKKLLAIRKNNDGMVAHLAKRMAQGISGKLDQDNSDGSLGEFYNPVSASITRSRCRLMVADFIWDNNLQDNLIAVQVDGVLVDREVYDLNNKWRFEGEAPALVLGKGEVWKPNKKPLNLTMDEVVEAMKAHPQRSSYKINSQDIIFSTMMGGDRIYKSFPANGKEALTTIFNSKPIILK